MDPQVAQNLVNEPKVGGCKDSEGRVGVEEHGRLTEEGGRRQANEVGAVHDGGLVPMGKIPSTRCFRATS